MVERKVYPPQKDQDYNPDVTEGTQVKVVMRVEPGTTAAQTQLVFEGEVVKADGKNKVYKCRIKKLMNKGEFLKDLDVGSEVYVTWHEILLQWR